MVCFTEEEAENVSIAGSIGNVTRVFVSPSNPNEMIKIFMNTYEDIERCLEVTKLLIPYYDELRKHNISAPSDLVYIDGLLRGYVMTRKNGKSLQLLTHKSSLEESVEALKKVGTLFRQMDELRKNDNLKSLYLNDIHSGNFLVDEYGAYAVDIDSAYYNGVLGNYSLFLMSQKGQFEKMKKYGNYVSIKSTLEIAPSRETELLGYAVMIISYLSGVPAINYMVNFPFVKYLNYLDSINLNKELLDILYNIFQGEDTNVNPDYLLDYIKEVYYKANEQYNPAIGRALHYSR